MAKSADSGPKSADEQNAIRREAKAKKRTRASSGTPSCRGPRSSGSLFKDSRPNQGARIRNQKLQDFLSRGRDHRRQASAAILSTGFSGLDEVASEAAIRAIELYGVTDPQISLRDGEIRIVASSFKLAVFTVREELNELHDEQDVQDGINAAGRALEAYRNGTLKAK